MGSEVSKIGISTLGTVSFLSVFGVAGVGYGLYLQYLEDAKKWENKCSEIQAKEKYMIETYGEEIKVYMEECKKEITAINEEDLCLSIHFFWNYLSILDLMALKQVKETAAAEAKKARLVVF